MVVGSSADYRNTDRCLSLSEVATKKDRLEQKIRKKHIRTKILYNRINNKQDEYFKEFAEIYNYKCAYCGAALKFTDIRLFEIDHFVCEAAYPNSTEGRAKAGKIENLVLSCFSCNRGKGQLHIGIEHQTILNPDDNSIAAVFFRDDGYYIKIAKGYINDSPVQLFYEKLMLGSEAKRLDFLLLEMDNLICQYKISNKKLADKLEQCKGRLMEKKNYTFI
jgi:5-methylcytosine-specific restriction endonuclease McrA